MCGIAHLLGILNITVLDCPGKTLWLASTSSILTLCWPGGGLSMSTVSLSLVSAHHQGGRSLTADYIAKWASPMANKHLFLNPQKFSPKG